MLVCAAVLCTAVSVVGLTGVAAPARADLGPPVPLGALLGQGPDRDAAVALSSDGETALVSTYDSVWVLVRSGTEWSEQAQLTPPEASYLSDPACSVSLSADGNTALVSYGGVAEGFVPVPPKLPAAAWVFTRVGQVWTEQAKLTPSEQLEQHKSPLFACTRSYGGIEGISAALSGDGETAILGVGTDDGDSGAVWIFGRSGSTWTQAGPKLAAPAQAGTGPQFGESVALSADGGTAIVGAPDASTDNGGASYALTREPSGWSLAPLVPQPNPALGAALLGSSVAISADGETALIGSPRSETAFVFTRSETGWTQQGPGLGPEPGGRGDFGRVVALAGGGNTALIAGLPQRECGKYQDQECDYSAGVWSFARTGASWVRQGPKVPGIGEFGSSLALSGEGVTALILGTPRISSRTGAAFLYTLTPPVPNAFSLDVPVTEHGYVITLPVTSSSAGTFSTLATIGARALRNLRPPRCRKHAGRRICPREKRVLYGTGTTRVNGPATLNLSVPPTAAIRKALRKSRSGQLKLKVTITFQPATGPAPPNQTLTTPVNE